FDRGLAGDFRFERYIWVPSAKLRRNLPKRFTLAFWCSIELETNIRRFFPADKIHKFIKKVFLARLPQVAMVNRLSAEERTSHRYWWQFYERVRRTREHLGNRLLSPRSLRVCRAGQGVSQRWSILPETVGLNARGEGNPWTLSQLLREGIR